MRNALWVFETEITITTTHAGVNERLEPRYSCVARQNRYTYLLTEQTELCDEAQFEINLNIYYVLQHTQFY